MGEMEAAQMLRALEGFLGQKRELWGWTIPSAHLFRSSLKVVTDIGTSQALTVCRCYQLVNSPVGSFSANLRFLVLRTP